jgi:hypothetical protein
MAEGTKRPRSTEPPQQGGGFVTGGDDAWTQQDPDTWAKMGTPNATPLRPADARRREATEGSSNGKHPPRPPRSVISGPPSRPPAPSPDVARMFGSAKGGDDPSTVVGSVKKMPSAPKPGVARIDGARMEIVNFDGVGSRAHGHGAHLDDGPAQPPPGPLDRLFPGHPPIRIVRRPRKEAAAGRVLLSVSVVVALGAFAWQQYDKYLASTVPSANKVIYTMIPGAEDAPATEGSGSGAPAAAPVGRLTIHSNRSATVYVDGVRHGEIPIDGVRIVMGMHEIKLVDEKTLESRTKKVKIDAGQPLTVSISF